MNKKPKSLRVTKQQFVSKMKYADSNLPRTDVMLVEAEYLAIKRLGFVLVDKQTLSLVSEKEQKLRELLENRPDVRNELHMETWLKKLVREFEESSLSVPHGEEVALRKRLEDLEAKAKTYIERIKELNARFQPLDSNMSLETYLEEKKKIKSEKTVSVADVKELLGGSQEPRKEKDKK